MIFALIQERPVERGPVGGPFDVPIGTSLWAIVIFVALLLTLRKFAWKPIAAALEKREQAIRDSLERAEKARLEVAESLKKEQEILDAARVQAVALVEAARGAAEKSREEVLAKARAEAQEVLDRGMRELRLQQESAAAQLRREIVDLAIAAAERVIRRSLGDEDHRRLAEEAVREAGGRL